MRNLLLLIGLGVGVLSTTCIAANAPAPHIYAFGDSYTDDGASARLTRVMVDKGSKDAVLLPGELYWQGRWSNGPTAVEVLAKQLGSPLTDYAVGGAKSGKNNYYAWMTPYQDTGLSGQIDQYLESERTIDPNALHFIFIGANDFFEHEDFAQTKPLDQLANEAVGNINSAIARLAVAGARRFMVVSSVDLSTVPAVVAGNQVDNARVFQQTVNSALSTGLQELAKKRGLEIVWFDHVEATKRLRSEPQRYGLSELNAPCQPTYPEVKPACAQPDSYFYWDEWHPTQRIHQLIGQEMAKRLM